MFVRHTKQITYIIFTGLHNVNLPLSLPPTQIPWVPPAASSLYIGNSLRRRLYAIVDLVLDNAAYGTKWSVVCCFVLFFWVLCRAVLCCAVW